MFIYLWTGIIMQKVNSSERESGVVRSTTGGTPSGTTSMKRIVSTSSTTSTALRKSSTVRGSYRRRARGSRAGVRTSVPISKSTTTKSTFGRLTGGFRRFIDSRKTRVTESSSSTSAPYRLQFGTDYIPVYRISGYGNRLLTYVRLHPTGLIFSSRPSIPLRSSSSVSSTTPTRITRSAGPSTKPLLTRTSSVREDFISWDQLIGVTCRKRELKIIYKNAAQQQNIPVDSGSKPSSESSILNLKFLLLADLKSFLTAGLLFGYFSNEKIAEAVLGQQDGGDVKMGNVSGKVQFSQEGESKNKTKKKGLFRFVRHLRTALSSKRNRNSHTINSNESAAPEEPTAISTLATTSTRPSTPPNPYVNWMNLNRKALNNRATISSPV